MAGVENGDENEQEHGNEEDEMSEDGSVDIGEESEDELEEEEGGEGAEGADGGDDAMEVDAADKAADAELPKQVSVAS